MRLSAPVRARPIVTPPLISLSAESRLPDPTQSRARPRHGRRRSAPDAVAIPVATEAFAAPSELEAAVIAAASGYRFGDIEVPATIARALDRMGFVTPTEVQARAIQPLREGKE